MAGRTPSFIVVGLVIIMFLLGLFYMSCSSKNTELRLSLEQFEERIRSLTIKNSDLEKKLENIITHKRELEEEKLNIQRQMEKKDSEINDLNTKLNEKLAELQTAKSDKTVVDEQLKEYKSMSEILESKNSLIEKLKQELNEQKQSNTDEIARLKQEYETLKNNQPVRNNQLPSSTFPIPPQRFRPFIANSLTTRSLSSLFQDPLNQSNNLPKEVKPQMVPGAFDINDKVLNAFSLIKNSSTSTILNEQQQQQQQVANEDKQNQEIGRNVPAPPLANNAQQRQQLGHVESAQAAPQPPNIKNEDNQPAVEDNLQNQHRLQRSLNDSLSDNKNVELPNRHENDDEEQIGIDNVQHNIVPRQNPMKQDNLEDVNHPIDPPSRFRLNNKNYRINNREQFRKVRHEQQIDNKERIHDIDNDNNNNNGDEEDQDVRKRNLL